MVPSLDFPNVLANKSTFWVYGWEKRCNENETGEEIPPCKAHRAVQNGAVVGIRVDQGGCGKQTRSGEVSPLQRQCSGAALGSGFV